MNLEQSDNAVLSGEWSQILQDLADAMRRYRDTAGPVRKSSLIYDKWTERIQLIEEAIDV